MSRRKVARFTFPSSGLKRGIISSFSCLFSCPLWTWERTQKWCTMSVSVLLLHYYVFMLPHIITVMVNECARRTWKSQTDNVARPWQGERYIPLLWLAWKDRKVHVSNRNNHSRRGWFNTANRAPCCATSTGFTPMVCMPFNKHLGNLDPIGLLLSAKQLGYSLGWVLDMQHSSR